MRIFPYLTLAVWLCACSVLGCADPIGLGTAPGTGGTAGSGGSPMDGGLGGMGGVGGGGGGAGSDCNETGCDDGNECTNDGDCNTLTGACIGGGDPEPIDTPCTQDGGFFCDGEGACVVCNDDPQCARFFPPEECREPATCVDGTCPIPSPLPDGTPCSAGQCFAAECVAVLPRRELVPMVCDNSNSDGFWEIPLDLTVAPTAIEATRAFEADIQTTLTVPQEFLQFALEAVFPTELSSLEIDAAGAEIVTSGVLVGSPVSTRLVSTPLVVPIPQMENPSDPDGPNLATDDIRIDLNPIFRAPYRAGESGEVCFDAGGAMPPSTIGAPPVRTGIRAVASNGALVRFECVGGSVDGVIEPNPPASQVCFPIETPDVDLCAGPPPVDCSTDDQCVAASICDPFDGQCSAGENEPRGTICDQDGGQACDGQGACVQCVENAGCFDDLNQCTTGPRCTDDQCEPLSNLPQGTVCNQDGGDRCDGDGNCIFVGDGPFPQSEELTLGCTNNIGSEIWIVPFELAVAPERIEAGEAFSVDLGGEAVVPEALLDSLQLTIVGGATRLDLIDARATVRVRVGAAGDEVTLETEPIPFRCKVDDAICDPGNDLPGVPGRRGNTDCAPVGDTNPCGRFVSIPTSDDCAPGGVCGILDGGTGTKVVQCEANGFCVTGDLRLPFQSRVESYTAAASGDVLFGWDDSNTGATVAIDGTWDLPPAAFEEPVVSNGLRISVEGLSVALECTMGVDSGGPDGVSVPDRSSPTPSSALIAFPIQQP